MEALSADLRRLRLLYDALDEPPTEKLAGICRRFCNPNSRLVYPSHRREKKKRMILDTIDKLEKAQRNLDMQVPGVPEVEDTKWPEDCSPCLRGWQVVDESNSSIDGNSVYGLQRDGGSSVFSLEYKDITENQESGSFCMTSRTSLTVSRNGIWWNDEHFSERPLFSETFPLIESSLEGPEIAKAIRTSKECPDEVLQENVVAEMASINAEKEVLLLKGVVVDALEQQGNRKCPQAEKPRLDQVAVEIETLVSPQVKHELVVLKENLNILGDSGGNYPQLEEFMTVLEALVSEVEIQQKLFDSILIPQHKENNNLPQHKDADDLTHSGNVGRTLNSVLDLISDIAKQLEAVPSMEVTDARVEVLDFQMRQLGKVRDEFLNVQECKGSVCRHGLLALFQMFLLGLGILFVFCEFSDRIGVAVPT